MMDRNTLDVVISVRKKRCIGTLDLTGGAPEMHQGFRNLVRKARALGVRVIDRCNLTILILGTLHPYPTWAEGNKYAAGEWKRAHAPQRLLVWLERYHAWRRGGNDVQNADDTDTKLLGGGIQLGCGDGS
jgi:hypothetical protein